MLAIHPQRAAVHRPAATRCSAVPYLELPLPRWSDPFPVEPKVPLLHMDAQRARERATSPGHTLPPWLPANCPQMSHVLALLRFPRVNLSYTWCLVSGISDPYFHVRTVPLCDRLPGPARWLPMGFRPPCPVRVHLTHLAQPHSCVAGLGFDTNSAHLQCNVPRSTAARQSRHQCHSWGLRVTVWLAFVWECNMNAAGGNSCKLGVGELPNCGHA